MRRQLCYCVWQESVHCQIDFHCVNKSQLTRCSADGHLGCFHFRDNMNKATTHLLLLEINTHVSWIHTKELTHQFVECMYNELH